MPTVVPILPGCCHKISFGLHFKIYNRRVKQVVCTVGTACFHFLAENPRPCLNCQYFPPAPLSEVTPKTALAFESLDGFLFCHPDCCEQVELLIYGVVFLNREHWNVKVLKGHFAVFSRVTAQSFEISFRQNSYFKCCVFFTPVPPTCFTPCPHSTSDTVIGMYFPHWMVCIWALSPHTHSRDMSLQFAFGSSSKVARVDSSGVDHQPMKHIYTTVNFLFYAHDQNFWTYL